MNSSIHPGMPWVTSARRGGWWIFEGISRRPKTSSNFWYAQAASVSPISISGFGKSAASRERAGTQCCPQADAKWLIPKSNLDEALRETKVGFAGK